MLPNLPVTPTRAARTAVEPDAQEDQLIARLLTTIWATRTGRALPPVPVGELSPEELLDFWADDQLEQPPAPHGPIAPFAPDGTQK